MYFDERPLECSIPLGTITLARRRAEARMKAVYSNEALAGAMSTTCIIGFDSAWTDNIRARGAVCALVMGNGGAVRFTPPCQASFKEALEFIQGERRTCDYCLLALDQPTIVPNTAGSRLVDRVAGSLIGFIGGGVQPANRSRVGMFDEGAPIWRFKRDLGAAEDPEVSRKAGHGFF
jgi:predicted RNase H-like nuclease